MSLEPIIRPFQDDSVAPTPFTKPGQIGVPPVRVSVGLRGGTKTFSFSGSSSNSTRIGHTHTEQAPTSQALQTKLASASS